MLLDQDITYGGFGISLPQEDTTNRKTELVEFELRTTGMTGDWALAEQPGRRRNHSPINHLQLVDVARSQGLPLLLHFLARGDSSSCADSGSPHRATCRRCHAQPSPPAWPRSPGAAAWRRRQTSTSRPTPDLRVHHTRTRARTGTTFEQRRKRQEHHEHCTIASNDAAARRRKSETRVISGKRSELGPRQCISVI